MLQHQYGNIENITTELFNNLDRKQSADLPSYVTTFTWQHRMFSTRTFKQIDLAILQG